MTYTQKVADVSSNYRNCSFVDFFIFPCSFVNNIEMKGNCVFIQTQQQKFDLHLFLFL